MAVIFISFFGESPSTLPLSDIEDCPVPLTPCVLPEAEGVPVVSEPPEKPAAPEALEAPAAALPSVSEIILLLAEELSDEDSL